MTFIPFIPEPKVLIKSSIERAKKRAKQAYGHDKGSTKKKREMIRVEVLTNTLSSRLENFVKDTVNFDNLPPFHADLVASLVDVPRIKKALAVIDWISKKIRELDRQYRFKMRRTRDIHEITRLRKQFEARIEDLLLSNSDAFDVLIDAGQKLSNLPKVKDVPTVIIAGYPNVGKSSILKALSGSDVPVREYPFTTKRILVGYTRDGYKEIQLIDTPGLLDRPLGKMNRIEKQALAAIKHLSDKVLFVVDPTETCGYTLDNQLKLLKNIRSLGLNVKVVANKSDISKPEKGEYDLVISALNDEDIRKLKDFLFEWLYG